MSLDKQSVNTDSEGFATNTAANVITDLEGLGPQVAADVEHGIQILLEHFRAAGQPLFPRKMSTFLQYGITVYSQEDILRECEKSSFIDCRLNAYPIYVDEDIDAGLVAPTILFTDIDRAHFENKVEMDIALYATIRKIKQTFNLNEITPMVLWTGNGFHIYIVVETKPLNLNERLVKVCPPNLEVSKAFLRFIEWYLTDGKCDPGHSATLSFKSCLLRIPGTFNSKCLDRDNLDDITVKIVKESIGVGVINKELLREFRYYLDDLKLAYLQEQERKRRYSKIKNSHQQRTNQRTEWVEDLLQTPIIDHRKYCIWRILAPYLLNIRKMSVEQTFSTISEWLDKCNHLRKLDFNSDKKIQEAIDRVEPEYLQIARKKLKVENTNLYGMLEEKGINI